MKCENIFCIYRSKGECTVEEISIAVTGMCTSCIYPAFDEDILSNAKAQLWDKFAKMDIELFEE